MLIDLRLAGKTVIVVGGGAEAYRKTQSFVDSGATIWVISKEFSNGIQKLGEEEKVILMKTDVKDGTSFVDCLNPKPDILLAATNDSKLNSKLVQAAKAWDCMVYSVDNPALSDFILPAVAQVGDVRVAVSTGGRSPAMAHVLRERIEKLVTPQDLLEIELQANVRVVLKEQVSDSKARSKLLYEILNNVNIKEALCEGKFQEAQKLAMKLIEKREK
ncbi:MAG TPA: bifunctional precorrin-2 dehydrogenase/sirohydrochlorin ferrochelatase [Candidatus Binatia bacterium]|nr:bifunctional precorrin-2 dehydrogenase/sirohydrochlorin ferrochelatase [Candidatus Binatia bacterium]